MASPRAYLDLLAGAGLTTDVWQTEYQHVLQGEDPVLEWLRGTGLRPVLGALAEGWSNAEIAATLNISVETVRTHIKRILTKLGVRDRTQAVVWAYRTGFLDAENPGKARSQLSLG